LVIEGDIINAESTARDVPQLRIALRDPAQKEAQFKIIDPPTARLGPGEIAHFKTSFDHLDEAATGVVVTFATKQFATAGTASPAPASQPTASSPVASTPGPTIPTPVAPDSPAPQNKTAEVKKPTPSDPELPGRTPKGIPLEKENFYERYLRWHDGSVEDIDADLRRVDDAVDMAHEDGLRCDSVSTLDHWHLSNGWTLECNDYNYKYYIQDKGRGWQIRIAD
jgi:hypothetical protein